MGMIVQNLPTLDPLVLTSISEALFEGFAQHLNITRYHNVVPGIKAGKQLVTFNRHAGLAGYKRTTCDTTANDSWTIPTTDKTWAPAYISDRFEECYDNYMETFIRWGLNNGVNKADLTGTELAAMITQQVQDLLTEVAIRHAWFGDTGIAAGTGNNLGAGDLKFFNAIDGFWAQLFDIATATPARLSTGLATKNGQATYALQKFNATDTTNMVASTTLDNMYYDADMVLRGQAKSDMVYLVSQTVYDQYERERKKVGGGAILEAYRRTEDGVPQLQCNGVDVIGVHDWDRTIATYLEDGTAWTLPHRAVLTTKSNMLLGVEEAGNLAEFDAWYSKDTEKYFIKFGFSLDAKVGVDNLVQVAY
jgi:hypothetical protein